MRVGLGVGAGVGLGVGAVVGAGMTSPAKSVSPVCGLMITGVAGLSVGAGVGIGVGAAVDSATAVLNRLARSMLLKSISPRSTSGLT